MSGVTKKQIWILIVLLGCSFVVQCFSFGMNFLAQPSRIKWEYSIVVQDAKRLSQGLETLGELEWELVVADPDFIENEGYVYVLISKRPK